MQIATIGDEELQRFALTSNPEIFLKTALHAAFKNISVLLKASTGCNKLRENLQII
ncbi:MAG: hypothetical protein ACK474_06050 [Pseudanabaena sp.]